MKASIKLREEQKPLIRAKIPLNILGLPFQSGIVAGESNELSLNLTTFFESGPSLKLSYRPNDGSNPFSLVFKTGIGCCGSPVSSTFNMSAEFNFDNRFRDPSFFVRFNPKFGDFSVKKTGSSVFKKRVKEVSGEDSPVIVDLFDSDKNFSYSLLNYPAAGVLKSALTGVDFSATTAMPLRRDASLSFRWGVRLPETVLVKKSERSMGEILFRKLPVLLINKIAIEHVARGDCGSGGKVGRVDADVAEGFWGVKKELEIVRAENGDLRKAFEGLKSEFVAVRHGANAVKIKGDKNSTSSNNNKEVIASFGGKGVECEVVNDE